MLLGCQVQTQKVFPAVLGYEGMGSMSLDQINEAFDLMHAGKSIRTVIHFSE